jgi:hypothetical protein
MAQDIKRADIERADIERADIERAAINARRKWKDSGDPLWAAVVGVLAWVEGSDQVADYLTEVLEAP